MNLYEYKILDLRKAVAHENEFLLNVLGNDGWAAVGLTSSGSAQTVILMRPKQKTEEKGPSPDNANWQHPFD